MLVKGNEPKLIKHIKRNGHITKNVEAIALWEGYEIDEMKRMVRIQLSRFPLSSNHLVYEETLAKIEAARGTEIAAAVLETCIESDKHKGPGDRTGLYQSFGRFIPTKK